MNNVLIIEDDKEICVMIKDHLEKYNYQVFFTLTGANAIERIKELSPDLIILDLMLPFISGDELIRNIRKFSDVPVIVVSAKSLTFNKVELLRLGADDYLLEGAMNVYWNYLKKQTLDGIDIITAQSKLIDAKGKYKRVFGNPYNIKEFRCCMKISHGSTLHNRKLFDELGNFDISFKICADYEFLLRKKLNARYIETPTIAMQVGGVSNTIRGLWESFKVKRYCKSIPLLLNVYYLTKGVIGYYMRKIKIIN